MNLHVSCICFLAACLGSCAVFAESIEVTGGLVLMGDEFVRRDLYMDNGVIVQSLPDDPDLRIDASGGWIVPPFAEAHCHVFLGGDVSRAKSAEFLSSGIFYAASLSNPKGARGGYERDLESVPAVDVIWTNGGVTRTECHPIPLYRTIHTRWQRRDPDTFMERSLGSVFHIADDVEQLRRIWPDVLSSEPDLVKSFLLHSESYDPGATMEHRGLDPIVFAELVELAHAEGLRITAHIESGRDFERAIEAGADAVAHLPYDFARTDPPEWDRLRISESAAELAAQRGLVVTATLSFVVRAKDPALPKDTPPPGWDLAVENLRTLKDAGATIIVGSDGASPVEEVRALAESGVFSNAELLRMWAIDTPRFIFPDRHLASFDPGAEASLLILDANPHEDIEATSSIRAAIKQGAILDLAPEP